MVVFAPRTFLSGGGGIAPPRSCTRVVKVKVGFSVQFSSPLLYRIIRHGSEYFTVRFFSDMQGQQSRVPKSLGGPHFSEVRGGLGRGQNLWKLGGPYYSGGRWLREILYNIQQRANVVGVSIVFLHHNNRPMETNSLQSSGAGTFSLVGEKRGKSGRKPNFFFILSPLGEGKSKAIFSQKLCFYGFAMNTDDNFILFLFIHLFRQAIPQQMWGKRMTRMISYPQVLEWTLK